MCFLLEGSNDTAVNQVKSNKRIRLPSFHAFTNTKLQHQPTPRTQADKKEQIHVQLANIPRTCCDPCATDVVQPSNKACCCSASLFLTGKRKLEQQRVSCEVAHYVAYQRYHHRPAHATTAVRICAATSNHATNKVLKQPHPLTEPGPGTASSYHQQRAAASAAAAVAAASLPLLLHHQTPLPVAHPAGTLEYLPRSDPSQAAP